MACFTCHLFIFGKLFCFNACAQQTHSHYGFNGSPTRQDHCDEVGHLIVDGHCVRAIHAETNAIIQAALHGVSTKGATCYVTHLPCINCTKALINAGIARIVYSVAYRADENAMNFLKAAKIEAEHKEFAPN